MNSLILIGALESCALAGMGSVQIRLLLIQMGGRILLETGVEGCIFYSGTESVYIFPILEDLRDTEFKAAEKIDLVINIFHKDKKEGILK